MPNETRNTDTLVKIFGIKDGAGSTPRSEQAFVSPCSSCQNYLSPGDSNSQNRAPCPRRLWQQAAQDQTDSVSITSPYLSESGTDNPSKLANPVKSTSAGALLVWCAAIDDNPAILDSDGNQVAPAIQDPQFFIDSTNTKFLRCRAYPYIPKHKQSALLGSGTPKEKDPVVITGQRHFSTSTGQSINVGGTVEQTGYVGFLNLVQALEHLIVGTG